MASRLFDAIFKHPTSAHVKKLAEGNLEFALNLYETIARQNESSNVFFSPFSITVALGMISVGTRNRTDEELRKVTKLDGLDDDDIHFAFHEVLRSLSNHDDKDRNEQFALDVANGMYVHESYSVSEDFLAIIKRQFMSEIKNVNFALEAARVTKEINEWVETVTQHKIQNLIPQGVINSLTRLVIVNAIYFKGNWKSKFHPQSTFKGEFHRRSKGPIQVELMRIKTAHYFAHDERLMCKIIELPYAGDRLAMFAILPDEIEGLSKLEKQFTSDVFKTLKSAMRPTPDVAVTFPKFKLEFGLRLNKPFHDLGIRELFIPEKADLTGICPGGDLYASDFIHKAFVEVNEDGTEAAAATFAVNRYRRAAARRETPQFIADHPFLFIVYDKCCDLILFMGRLTDPSH